MRGEWEPIVGQGVRARSQVRSCLGWQWRYVEQNLCLLPLPAQGLAQGLKDSSLEQTKTLVRQEQAGAGAEVWRQE